MACFTMKTGKAVWDYAKANHIDKPLNHPDYIHDFRDLTWRIADDLRKRGLNYTPEEIAKLISMPKTVKVARDKLLNTDYNRSKILGQAREFSAGKEKSALARFAKTAYELPYALKVLGHSAALHMTHAWTYAFDPKMWSRFGESWVDSWKAINPSQARSISERIIRHPDFDEQMKAGLAADPRKIYDDVNRRASYWGQKLGKLIDATSNSFIGLKELRQFAWDMHKTEVLKGGEHLWTDDMKRQVANHINHMTGASPEVRLPEVARVVAFAPSLDVARVKRITDFGKAVTNAWNKADPETQFMARQNMKQWARIAATASSMLYLNHLLLKNFFGSKEDINIKDPFKGDWLAGKGPSGRVWQFTGGQVPLIRAATRAVARPQQAGTAIGDYLMGKLNPALQVAKGLRTGKLFGGEDVPKPFGAAPATFGNWTEWALTELGPISTEDGIKEFSKQMSAQNGLPESHNRDFLQAFWKAGLVTIPAVIGTHTYQPLPRTQRSKLAFDPSTATGIK